MLETGTESSSLSLHVSGRMSSGAGTAPWSFVCIHRQASAVGT